MGKQTTKKQREAIVHTLSTSGLSGDKGLGCYCGAMAALASLRAIGTDQPTSDTEIRADVVRWGFLLTNAASPSNLSTFRGHID